jgi:hypothetical protein
VQECRIELTGVDPLREIALDEDAPSLRSCEVCKLWCDACTCRACSTVRDCLRVVLCSVVVCNYLGGARSRRQLRARTRRQRDLRLHNNTTHA